MAKTAEIHKKRKGADKEFEIIGLNIRVKIRGGEYIDLDLDRDVEKALFGLLYNFFGKDLPLNEDQLQNLD